MPNKPQVKKAKQYPTPNVGDTIEMCKIGGCSPQFLGKGRTCKHKHLWARATVTLVNKANDFGAKFDSKNGSGGLHPFYRAWRPLPVKKVTEYPKPKVGDKIEMCKIGGCSPQFLGKGRTCKHTSHEWVEATVFHLNRYSGRILATGPGGGSDNNWSSDYRAWRPLPVKAAKKSKTMLRMPDLGKQPPPLVKPATASRAKTERAMSNILAHVYGAPATTPPSANEDDIEAMAYEVQIRHPFMGPETCFATAKRFFEYADKLAGKGK